MQTSVVQTSSNMIQAIVFNLKKLTIDKLKNIAESPHALDNVPNEMQETFALHENPFMSPSSQYLENKHFVRNGSLILLHEKVLGHRFDKTKDYKETKTRHSRVRQWQRCNASESGASWRRARTSDAVWLCSGDSLTTIYVLSCSNSDSKSMTLSKKATAQTTMHRSFV